MILVVARWTIKKEFLAEVGTRILELQKQTRLEPGNLAYDLYRGQDNPCEVLIYEKYETQKALEAHRESLHFKSIVVNDLLAKLEDRHVDVSEIP